MDDVYDAWNSVKKKTMIIFIPLRIRTEKI